ncbi:TIGR04255 family protein [Azomonas macrocytogenes]|uniref:Uncharacterized protein (TIGR04255 family) n=1 Tax=Azomonas macrocytogenes TaxID=69962 RepID=A0A839T8G9_AZOMA|nr:TIGR04255 family protein [Azomonas macrocytogenes]MBB3105170.1 uncharacterized protein (TIGR04255 family) [Azomonas macrocytogenes]
MADRAGVLPNAPLVYTLSVVRFSPLLKLSKLIADIQHELREYLPEYFQMAKALTPMQPATEPNSWAFLDRELKYACVLSNDYMLLQSIAYLHFDQHCNLFKKCLEAVIHQAGELDVIGIGMRYVDRIEPREGETLSSYLPAALLPLDNELISKLKDDRAVDPIGVATSTYHFNPEFLHVRCWRQPGMWVPEDLIEPAMVFEIAKQSRQPPSPHRLTGSPLAFNQTSNIGALLDIDAYWPLATTERLKVKEIAARLDRLHSMANSAFRSVATEHAFNIWSEKP